MGVSVAFDYDAWLLAFPEFSAVGKPAAQGYFDMATMYHSNDGRGPVKTAAIQSQLLNLVTAHIAQLFAPPSDGSEPSQVVGRISSASEGSVSVSTEYKMPDSATEAWFNQTKYGASYWAATALFRVFQYRAPSARNFDPWPRR